MYTEQDIQALIELYRDGLLNDTLPFWLRHSIDKENGGFFIGLDRDGSVIHTDKPIWIQGRFIWLLATLYNEVEPREEWLNAARHGVDFLRKHCFDTDGRMFFSTTAEGKPLRKRRYLFTETFGVIALAAYAKAANDEEIAEEARRLFRLILHYINTPDSLPSKVNPETRSAKGLGLPMILMATAQVLRETIGDVLAEEIIDRSIAEIKQDFINEEYQAVMEMVGPKGELIDTFEGRLLTPGHALEAGWFILHEARYRNNDPELIALGCKIIDWSWKWGWDEEHGGIIYFRDIKNLPCTEYWHDMKFWWPQNEAIIATLLAWKLTGEDKYAQWHRQIHEWAYELFPDQEYGEWFGYFHRDGRLSTPLKGNMFKGPFHLPRMQLYCWKLLAE